MYIEHGDKWVWAVRNFEYLNSPEFYRELKRGDLRNKSKTSILKIVLFPVQIQCIIIWF